MRSRLRLNIRQKVAGALTLAVILIGSIGALSYDYLRQVERNQRIVEIADDLSNVILEARRYEKNYLLYGMQSDLDENSRYVQKGIEVLDSIEPEIADVEGALRLDVLQSDFYEYRNLMQQIQGCRERSDRLCAEHVEERLRETGKTMVDIAQELVSFEREKVLTIIRTLKAHLLYSLLVFLGLSAFLIPVVARGIIRPLRAIEETTHRIAQGHFSLLPVVDSGDETQRVVEVFNRMVMELQKRQDQLLQAKKLSSLGILTSGIAHQLNNPLNNISTSCQILIEELGHGDAPFLRKMLANVEQEVRRARDTVRGLLEFSRVKEFALNRASLWEVVESSVRLISSQLPPGVDLLREVPKEMMLYLDSQRMQQVFLNLLMNAIQAIESPPGQVRIHASTDAAQDQAVITLEDTGIGIADKDLPRIFDPFFTTKDVSSGTGLGLSIVYGIIQRHQGTITVESKQGEGTRFTIRLPLRPSLTPTEPASEMTDPGSLIL
ncbi:MAG: ATP-binding protein [Acidobacteriota bacterium]